MIGWVDAQAGVSGDMLLGALLDAGVPLEVLQEELDSLGLQLHLRAAPTTRAGLAATKAEVLVAGTPAEQVHDAHRSWADVRALLDRLPDPTLAQEAFRRLAEAEASVHGCSPDDVVFHEVGALDAIGDVVAVCRGLQHLGLERLSCSRVALGSGTTRGAHGALPVPVPAVLHLLQGGDVEAGPSPYESTTPTGAALLATWVDHWEPLPAMRPVRTGVGAGTRDPEGVCNAVRLVLGEASVPSSALLLECNVDDLDPRLWPGVLDALLAVGASDAWLTPVLMKKGRPAHMLSVLCSDDVASGVRGVVFRETTTLGLRESRVGKHALERAFVTVDVAGCAIAVKQGWYGGELVTSQPEWADVARTAEVLGWPVQDVLAAARAAAP